MKKQKLICTFLSVILYAGLCGCSAPAPSADPTPVQEYSQVAFLQYLYVLPESAELRSIAAVEKCAIVTAVDAEDDFIILLRHNAEKSRLEFEAPVAVYSECREYLYGAATDGKNFFVLRGPSADESGYASGRFSIIKISPDGGILSEISTDEIRLYLPRGIVSCGENLMIYGSNYLYIVSPDGRILVRHSTDHDIWAVQHTKDGVFLQLIKNIDYPTYTVDPYTGELVDADTGNLWLTPGISDYCGKLLYIGEQLTEYDAASKVETELFNWTELTGTLIDFDRLCRISDDCYLYNLPDSGVLCAMTVESMVDERQVISVACLGDGSQISAGLLSARFNLSNREYKAKLQMYEYTELETALSTESCPDIIFFDNEFDTSSSMFTDMLPLLDADPLLSVNDFVPGLIEGLSADGHLRELWYSFIMNSFFSSSELTGGAKNLKFSDYEKISAELDDVPVMPVGATKLEVLDRFMAVGIDDHIDLENWTCGFDTQEFKAILSLCNSIAPNEFYVEEGGPPVYFPDSIIHPTQFSSLESFSNSLNTYGENCIRVQSPVSDRSASFQDCWYGTRLVIPAKCKNVENAWQFVRYVMSTEGQMNLSVFGGIPTNTEALEHQLKSKLSDEHAAAFRELLSTKPAVYSALKQHITDIVKECAQSYFSGDRSLDEAAAMIQSRVKIYLAEKAPL